MKTINGKTYIDVRKYAVLDLGRFDQMQERLNKIGSTFSRHRVISITQHQEKHYDPKTICVVEYWGLEEI